MAEQLTLDSLEYIRREIQIPDGFKTGRLRSSGKLPIIEPEGLEFEPNLEARIRLGSPPDVDIDRAEALATAVNEGYGPDVRIDIDATILNQAWVKDRYSWACTQARLVSGHYQRATSVGVLNLLKPDTRRIISQTVAEYLVGRAITPALTEKTVSGAEPTTYYNSFEIAALRAGFPEEHVLAGKFLRALSDVALRKHHAQPLLALMYDSEVSSDNAYSVYKELVVPCLSLPMAERASRGE